MGMMKGGEGHGLYYSKEYVRDGILTISSYASTFAATKVRERYL